MRNTSPANSKAPVGDDDWAITFRGEDGKQTAVEVYGKIALQDHWTLVLDPEDRSVVFATPNINVISVEPAHS